MVAINRVIQVAEQVGAAFFAIDAKDNAAAAFYERFGFRRIPGQPLKLWSTVAELEVLDREARQSSD